MPCPSAVRSRSARRALAKLLIVVAAAAVGAAIAGCGSAGRPGRHARGVTLALDFTPNAVHAGIYTALARGFDRAAGVALHVIVPAASTDSLHLLEAGRVQLAILDIHDLALADERGAQIVAVLPIVQQPLAAVIAAPDVRTPRSLEHRTVGVTGDASDLAVLHSIVAGAGGRPGSVHTITIGFDAVADLLTGRVSAATAFWSDEGVALARRRPGFHIFKVTAYGAPAYPELVLCATRGWLDAHRTLAAAAVRAVVRGYRAALADPAAAAHDLEAQVPGLDPGLVSAELHALAPAFRGPGGTVGAFSAVTLRAWARWEARFAIVPRVPDVARMFDLGFASGR